MTPAPKPDIVERLRLRGRHEYETGWAQDPLCHEAAAAIEALRAELEEHRAAGWALMTETSDLALGDKDGGPEAVIDNIIAGIKALRAERDAAAQAADDWSREAAAKSDRVLQVMAERDAAREALKAAEEVARALVVGYDGNNPRNGGKPVLGETWENEGYSNWLQRVGKKLCAALAAKEAPNAE